MPNPTITIDVDVSGLQGAKGDLRSINVEVRRIARSQREMGVSSDKASKRVTASARKQARATRDVAKRTRGFKGAMDDLARSVRVIEGPLGGTAARLQTFVSILKTARPVTLAFIAAITVLGVALAVIAPKAVRAAASMQRIRLVMKFAIGDADRAADSFNFLRKTSRELGIDLETTALDFAKFVASARGTRLEGEGVKRTFTAIAQVAALLSMSAEQVAGTLKALTDMMSKGTVQAEELKGQLGDRLVGALRITAQGMKMTTDELLKMMKDGKILAEDLIPALTDELLRLTEEDIAAGISTITSEFNRLKTSLFEFLAAIGEETGLGEFVSGIARSVTGMTDVVTNSIRIAGAEIGQLAQLTRVQLEDLIDSTRVAALNLEMLAEVYGEYPLITNKITAAIELQTAALAELARRAKPPKLPPPITVRGVPIFEGAAFRTPSEAHLKKVAEMGKLWDQTRLPLEKYRLEMTRLINLQTQFPEFSDSISRAMLKARDDFNKTDVTMSFLGRSFDSLATGIVSAMSTSAKSMEDFKSIARKVVDSILEDMLRLTIIAPIKEALFGGLSLGKLFGGETPSVVNPASVGGSASVSSKGFQHGGSFTVGGRSGADANLVSFAATAGERVTVQTPEQMRRGGGGGGMNVFIDATGADQAAVLRLEQIVQQLDGTLERRAVAAVVGLRRREPSTFRAAG